MPVLTKIFYNLCILTFIIDTLFAISLFRRIATKKSIIWEQQSLAAISLMLFCSALSIKFSNIIFLIFWLIILCYNFLIPQYLRKKLDYAIFITDQNLIESTVSKLKFFMLGDLGKFYQKIAQAYTYSINKKFEQCNQILESLEKQFSNNSYALQNIEMCYIRNLLFEKQWHKILILIENKLKQNPQNNFLNLYSLRAALELDDYENALNYFEKSKLENSFDTIKSAGIFLNYYYAKIGDIDKCKTLLEYARLNNYKVPDFYKYYFTGLAYTNSGNFDLAQENLIKLHNKINTLNLSAIWHENYNTLADKINNKNHSVDNNSETIEKFKAKLNSTLKTIYYNNLFKEILVYPKIIDYSIMVLVSLFLFQIGLPTHYIQNRNYILDYSYSIDTFGLNNLPDFANIYRLITYSFLHANAIHLLVNLAGLYWLGPMIINLYGKRFFFLLWFSSAIIGGLFHCLFNNSFYVVGCSASIMGLVGAYLMSLFKSSAFILAKIRNNAISFWITALVIQFMIDKTYPNIDGSAHIGGIITGITLAGLFKFKFKEIFNFNK